MTALSRATGLRITLMFLVSVCCVVLSNVGPAIASDATLARATTYAYDARGHIAQETLRIETHERSADPSISKPKAFAVAKPAKFPGSRYAAKTGASGAGNAANGVRLSGQLARESAESAFTGSGRLTQGAIDGSRPIISGDKLGNANLVKALTSDGSKIGDWGKYATQTYQSPSGNFQAHFYMNSRTGAVNYDFDYKVVFAR